MNLMNERKERIITLLRNTNREGQEGKNTLKNCPEANLLYFADDISTTYLED